MGTSLLKPTELELRLLTNSQINEILAEKLDDILRPRPHEWPDQWADANRILPKGSAESGPMRTNRAPYVIPVMRASVMPGVRRCSASYPSQAGKTENYISVIGERAVNRPGPMLWIGSTKNSVEKVIFKRMRAMIKQSKQLQDRFEKSRSTKHEHAFMGDAMLRTAWAGSTSELASDSAWLVIIDELDRMVADLLGEGNIVELGDARWTTYEYDGRTLVISTPTEGRAIRRLNQFTGFDHWEPEEEGSIFSPIWQLWQESSAFEWAWPCPDCHEYFVPHKNLIWLPENCSVKHAKTEVRLTCHKCGVQIPESLKAWMNERGSYVGPGQRLLPYHEDTGGFLMVDSAGENDVREAVSGDSNVQFHEFGMPPPVPIGYGKTHEYQSFWVSGFSATWQPWGDMAQKFVLARKSGDPARMKTVMNTKFGEMFALAGEAPTRDLVEKCCGDFEWRYKPHQGQLLFHTVDVQGNGFWVTTRWWGANWESWLYDHQFIEGATDHPGSWSKLDAYLSERIHGRDADMVLIDSGYRREYVVDYLREKPEEWLATFGASSPIQQMYIVNQEEIKLGASKKPYQYKRIKINTDFAKHWVHSRIRRTLNLEKDEPPDWWIPRTLNEQHAIQILAEERVPDIKTGKPIWRKKHKNNHGLDTEGMQVIAALLSEVHDLVPLPPPEEMAKPKKEDDIVDLFAANNSKNPFSGE